MAVSYVANYPQLLRTIATDQKIVYLCGAGASMSLAEHNMNWTNWILAGKDYLDAAEQLELEKRIGSWTTNELINAATFLLESVKAAGKYEPFMTATIGSQHPRNDSFQDALRKIWRSGDLIATTNYDLTIEEAVDAHTVSYSSPADILSVIRGGENKVIHLHGVYDRLNHLDDIVADDPQYKGILANAGAQFIQNLISTQPLIIIGCGGTLEDPNLSGFMSFVIEKLGISNVPYFYLMKNGDAVPGLPANAIPVFYGDDYNDLPVFLSELAMLRLQRRAGLRNLASVNPYQDIPRATSAFGRIHFSNGFNEFVGRDEEIQRLNEFLTDGKQFSWGSVLGDGGFGKSRLVLEWLKTMPFSWFGFFTYKRPGEVRRFIPFTDTVVVFDYVLGKEQECAQTIEAYLEAFDGFPYKLRILFIERSQGIGDTEWLTKIRRSFDSVKRVEFEAGEHGFSFSLSELSLEDEKAYVKKYLHAYLPLLRSTAFIENCMTDVNGIAARVEETFRTSFEPACYRPLFLSIFTEVWISKEGQLSLNSVEELLSEYLNKEKNRWKLILEEESLVDSYVRLLAMACAIGDFDITDVYGQNYLEEDAKKLTEFFDNKSGKPGADNFFTDLFVHMDKLVEDDGDDTIIESFAHPGTISEGMDDDDERFAFSAPYIKLNADPREVYLQMKANVGAADDDELKELERIRGERIKRVEELPDHAWIIEPVFPDIIKEFIVFYAVNDRDIVRFTKLARSNSILGLSDFITRALEDWGDKPVFQKMAVTPPDEMLNYFEYYVSLLISLRNVEDIRAVEQALIDSDPCFPRYEMELWRRISIVLTDRKNVDRLYDSSCRFIEYLDSVGEMIHIREEVADVIKSYCSGLHNAEASEKHEDFLKKCERIGLSIPENVRVGEVLCEGYRFLIKLQLYRDNTADVSPKWEKIMEIIRRYDFQKSMCEEAMHVAHDYLLTLIRKNDLGRLHQLEEFVEEIYRHLHIVDVAEIAALCSANIYSVSYMKRKGCLTEEHDKVKKYFDDFPESMHIRAAFLSVSKVSYLDTSTYRKVPDKLLNSAKAWAQQYPEEIEFPEGYFGLLMARLEYAQAYDLRNEQRRLFKEMKSVAEKTDYSEYNEKNDMLEAVKRLQQVYGY